MAKPLFDLNGRVTIVTGGLGQLGQQYSRALIDQGGRVAILDCQKDSFSQAFSDIDDDHIMYVDADVTSRETLEFALGQITSHWETPFGLINNAALDSPPDAPAEETGPFETYPVESWEKIMAVNSKGVFLCCQVFGGAMAGVGQGSIVNIGSTYGIVSPDQSLYDFRRRNGETFFKPVAYAASKSSLYNLTRYLATYWGESNVRVNIMTIGGVFNNQPQEFLSGYSAKVPMKRMAHENEYNGAIVFLISDASSYMTGSTMTIDGGWTAW